MDTTGSSTAGRVELACLDQTSRRRQELLELLDQFDPNIDQLTEAIEEEAQQRPEVERLQTHPGVGPLTALAYVLVLGTPDRFSCGKQVGSYLGPIRCEDSSADHWRLGHISKQGNGLIRYLLGQSALRATRLDDEWRRQYAHLTMHRSHAVAKVAMARKLAVRFF